MRNKDKHRRKPRQVSPPTSRKATTKDGSKHKGSTQDLSKRQDDYGFLDTRKHRPTKNTDNAFNSKDRQVEQSFAKQANDINSPTATQRLQHSYNKQSYHYTADIPVQQGVLTFYPKQAAERTSRSASRQSRPCLKEVATSSRLDHSRSKSRDIVALYTAGHPQMRSRSSTPAGCLGSYIYKPADMQPRTRPKSCTSARSSAHDREHPQLATPTNNYTSRSTTPANSIISGQYERSRSLMRGRSDRSSFFRSISPGSRGRRAKSESRYSSISRDAISMYSNLSTQSRALSNSEIASQNLELWMTTTSKHQGPGSRSRSRSRKPEKKEEIVVTLLEMDADVNKSVENSLDNANSIKPANIKMMMIAGHTPSDNWESKDEIEVKPGAIIVGLYKQNEWLFITTEYGSTGYVPYAYTKAVKQERLQKPSSNYNDKVDRTTAPEQNYSRFDHRVDQATVISSQKQNSAYSEKGATRQRSQHPCLRSQQNRAHNQIDQQRDSLSSNNSVFLEELMCLRPAIIPRQILKPEGYADCLVVDMDNKYNGMGHDELRAYCSDSGISEPNSNHSDELDQYVSLSNRQTHRMATPGSRSSLESSNFHENHSINYYHRNPSDSDMINHRHQKVTQSPGYNAHPQINFMPLGPLGERLRRNETTPTNNDMVYEQPLYCNISQDMRARAQPVTEVGAELNPKIPKDYNGPRARVIYDYKGDLSDDVHVMAGDVVTILNSEDVEWIWVMRRDGVEGFMPREYVLPMDICQPKLAPNRANHQEPYLVVAL